MKTSFKALGKAVAYFAVYLLVQVLVSTVFSTVISARMTMEMMASGEELDVMSMTDALIAEVMSKAMEMTFIAGLVTLFIFWIVFLIRKKKFTKEVCIRKIPVTGIFPIAIMAAAFNVITTVIISFMPWPQEWMDSYVESSSAIDGSAMAWFTAVLMAPVLEEIVFRGLMYTRLKRGLPAIVAAIITSLAFGIAHGTVIWAIYTFVFSMILIWVFEKFQSLTACIVLHMVYNLSGMALSLIPEEAGILIMILFVISIAGVVFAYKMIEKVTVDISSMEEVPVVEAVMAEEVPAEE
ncbi:MAG: CPBP family intramembrane metalloprotease [Roseburia sp.]|nr:CPBP family intramembrane metalloprotease [Roseburia sp.]